MTRGFRLFAAASVAALFIGQVEAHAALHQQTTGTVKVTVGANWQGVVPDARQRFELCLSGPSYAKPNCWKAPARGGALAWNGVQPGQYTVAQTALGPAWATAPFSDTLDVAAGQTTERAISNTFVDSLNCPLIDGFDRPGTSLNPQWTGDTTDYVLANGAVSLADNGLVYWDGEPKTFGSDQTACVTLLGFNAESRKQGLVLKGQSVWEPAQGLILVNYNPANSNIELWTQEPGKTDLALRAAFAVPLAKGDQLGARALRDGTVRMYKNGALIGAAKASTALARRAGRIGLWHDNAANAAFDNFGGQ